jgi:hypothetical protein
MTSSQPQKPLLEPGDVYRVIGRLYVAEFGVPDSIDFKSAGKPIKTMVSAVPAQKAGAAPKLRSPPNCRPERSHLCIGKTGRGSCVTLRKKCRVPASAQVKAVISSLLANSKLDKTAEGLWRDPKNPEQFIENGKIIMGADLFDRLASSQKKLDEIDRKDAEYKSDPVQSYLERKRSARLLDPDYVRADQEFQAVGENFARLKTAMLAGPVELRKGLTSEFLSAETEFHSRNSDILTMRAKLDAQFDKADPFLVQSNRDRSQVQQVGDEALSRLLKTSGISDAEIKQLVGKIKIPKGDRTLKNDLAMLAQITGGHGFESLKEVQNKKGRAFAQRSGLIVKPKGSMQILAHELGHHVEFESDIVLRASKAWVSGRATGEERSLRVLTGDRRYKANETATPDNFINPYVGKKYLASTEVVSMGVEQLYSPQSLRFFASTDPEHFAYTVGVIRRPRNARNQD